MEQKDGDEMKIVCTKEEKPLLIDLLNDGCPFDNTPGVECEPDCIKCIKKNIEWEITNE